MTLSENVERSKRPHPSSFERLSWYRRERQHVVPGGSTLIRTRIEGTVDYCLRPSRARVSCVRTKSSRIGGEEAEPPPQQYPFRRTRLCRFAFLPRQVRPIRGADALVSANPCPFPHSLCDLCLLYNPICAVVLRRSVVHDTIHAISDHGIDRSSGAPSLRSRASGPCGADARPGPRLVSGERRPRPRGAGPWPVWSLGPSRRRAAGSTSMQVDETAYMFPSNPRCPYIVVSFDT